MSYLWCEKHNKPKKFLVGTGPGSPGQCDECKKELDEMIQKRIEELKKRAA